ncbi:MAG: hypothetical protein ABR573_10400 [Candidatus Dormibacteria bacterium]
MTIPPDGTDPELETLGARLDAYARSGDHPAALGRVRSNLRYDTGERRWRANRRYAFQVILVAAFPLAAAAAVAAILINGKAPLAGSPAAGATAAPVRSPTSTPGQLQASPGPLALVPREVAFSGPTTGWAVGARCDDGGAAAKCDLLVSSTQDGGSTWTSPVFVGRPDISVASIPAVHIRVSGASVWVFGPGIYGSHDGGRSWRPQDSRAILSLETSGGSAWAVAGCTRNHSCVPHLITSTAQADAWADARVQPTTESSNDAYLERPNVNTAFLVQIFDAGKTATRSSLAVTRDGGRSWGMMVSPCPDPIQVRSLDGRDLWALCTMQGGTGYQPKAVFLSNDGARSWQLRAQSAPDPVGSIEIGGYARSLVVTSPSAALYGAQRGGVSLSLDQGRTWMSPTTDVPTDSAGVDQLWFVTARQGWALGNFGAGRPTLYGTSDGGHSWKPLGNPLGPPFAG